MCPLSPFLFNIVLEVWAGAIRKRNKTHSNRKGRSKTVTIYRWHDTILENPKDHQKLLELLDSFSKAAGYKINIQKKFVMFYTLIIND